MTPKRIAELRRDFEAGHHVRLSPAEAMPLLDAWEQHRRLLDAARRVAVAYRRGTVRASADVVHDLAEVLAEIDAHAREYPGGYNPPPAEPIAREDRPRIPRVPR